MARSKQVQRVVESLKTSPEKWRMIRALFHDQLISDDTVISVQYPKIFKNGCEVYFGHSFLDNRKLKKAVREFIDNYE